MHYLGIDISKKSLIVSILDQVVPFYFITHNQKREYFNQMQLKTRIFYLN